MNKIENENSKQLWDGLLESLNDDYYSNIVKNRLEFAYSVYRKENLVLDIGSGQGYLEKYLFDRDCKLNNWYCLDISKVGLSKIKEKYHVHTRMGRITKIPFESNLFDSVFCLEVLEHLSRNKIHIAYSELRRILKRDGFIVLSVPVYEPIALKNHVVGHYRKYTPQVLLEEIESAGFVVTKQKYIYSFKTLYKTKKYFCDFLSFRRPSVFTIICQKK